MSSTTNFLNLTPFAVAKKISISENNQVKKEKKYKMFKSSKADVKIKLLRTTSKMPTKGTEGSAAYDLYSDNTEDIVMQPLSTILVNTGVSMKLPDGYCALVLPRSGLSLKTPIRISNAPGLIDSDYQGELKVIVDNIGQGFVTIKPQTRIAQLLILPTFEVKFHKTNDLGPETKRGKNGFGSTGTN